MKTWTHRAALRGTTTGMALGALLALACCKQNQPHEAARVSASSPSGAASPGATQTDAPTTAESSLAATASPQGSSKDAAPEAAPALIGALAPEPPSAYPPPPKLAARPPAGCGMPPTLVARGWQKSLTPTSRAEPTPLVLGSVTLALLPDTQYYADCRSPHFVAQSRWVAATAKERNTAAALHLGDITEKNIAEEWEYAVASLAPLSQTMPVMLATGNHDYGNEGRADRRFTSFAEYFGKPAPVTAPFVAATMVEGDVENAYYRMRLPKVTLGVLVLEWSPRTKTVEWADATLAKFPNDRVIVVTHAYLYHDGTRYDWRGKGPAQEWNPAAYGTGKKDPDAAATASNLNPSGMFDGQALWDALIRKHAGIFLTLNGHVLDDGVGVLESTGDAGNRVAQVLVNYQMLDEGGLGYLRLMELLPDGRTLRMKTYSPSLELFATGPTQNFELSLQPPLW